MNIIKECLTSWIHINVLRYLMNARKPMSERQLGKILGVPSTTMNRALRSLGETGLIKPHPVGRATHWNLDKKSYLYEMVGPILEGTNTIIPPLKYLKRFIIETLKLPKDHLCYLFGSTFSGEDSSSSDIDICITLPKGKKEPSPSLKERIEALQEICWEKFSRPLNPIFINKEVFNRNPSWELHKNILKGVEIRYD